MYLTPEIQDIVLIFLIVLIILIFKHSPFVSHRFIHILFTDAPEVIELLSTNAKAKNYE